MKQKMCLFYPTASRIIIISSMSLAIGLRGSLCWVPSEWLVSGEPAWYSRLIQPRLNISKTSNTACHGALYLEEYESLLLRKPSGRSNQPHGGGTLISTSSREYELFNAVQRAHDAVPCRDEENVPPESDPSDLTNPVDATDTENPSNGEDEASRRAFTRTFRAGTGRRLLRRLSHAEYDASLRAILGESTDAAANLAADNVVNGYAHNADALTVSPLLAAQYAELAEELGSRIAYQNVGYQACITIESAGTCFRDLLVEFLARNSSSASRK